MTRQTFATVAQFIETAPDAMIVADPDGVVQIANSRANRMFQATDLVGHTVEELIPARFAEVHRSHRARFREAAEPRAMGAGAELVARRMDDTEFPVDVSLGVVEIDGVSHVSAAVRDVSAQKAEQAAAAVFEFVVASTREAIFACDDQGLVTIWNRAAERLTGRSADSVIGAPLAKSLVSSDGVELDRLIQRVLDGELIENVGLMIRRPEGRETAASLSISLMRDRRGRAIGADGIVRDISEQVELQSFLAEAQERLTQTQRLAGIGLWAWDVDHDEMQWSEEMYRLMGVSPMDFDAHLESCLVHVHDDARDELRDAMRAAAAHGTSFEMEHGMRRPDGGDLWVYVSGDAVTDERGRVLALRGICQDLTERHRAIESLREADRLKDEFLATVSHELRTPLTVINGFARVLQMGASEDQAVQFEAIIRNSEEMRGMVERMLDFSRIQSGRAQIQVSDIPLGPLVDDVLELVGSAFSEHDFQVDIDRELVLRVDPAAFPRVFVNLLTNAAKFTPPGRRITLRGRRVGAVGRLEVRDEGPGIPPELTEKVFERFFQVTENAVAAKRGTGVGLSIARSYARSMGGRVWAESEPGEGATFVVELPLATVGDPGGEAR